MTRFITAFAVFTAVIFVQQTANAAAVALEISPKVEKTGTPLCINLSLENKVDLLSQQAIASLNLNDAFDHVKPKSKKRVFEDVRPHRFSTSDIS